MKHAMTRLWAFLFVATAAIAFPAASSAHVDGSLAGGFVSGLAHPVLGPDHVLAMLAVGLWGAQLGNPAVWVLPVAFPMVMSMGGTMGLLGFSIPGVEVGIAASAIALGLAVLTEARPPLWIAAVLVGFFAVFHGHAHGTELPDGANGFYYSIGFVVSTGSLHAAGIALGLTHRWPAGRLALRMGGAVVALGGAWFLLRTWA